MCTIVDDALDLRLIMHVVHEFNASIVSHNRRPLLVSLITPVKIPEFGLYPLRLVLKGSAAPIQLIVVGGDVVVPRPGRLVSSLIVD